MHRLLIRHAGGLEFEVQRVDGRGAKSAPKVELIDPLGLTLGGTEYTLGHELAWYLEAYLDLPTGPNEMRADRVLAALKQWGQESFLTLFDRGQARNFYYEATRTGHSELQLVVASDDPRVLSWPWEALSDPLVGDLAFHCRIERQLDEVPDPLPLPDELPQDRVRILLVTARPLHSDIAYRSITRPLVDLIRQEQLPAEVKLLRPPTFAQLQREFTEHPGQYHIVHFDCHGGFGSAAAVGSDRFRGPQGQLLFEDVEGGKDPVSAEQLSHLLREHRIPIAVLNACQSAMLSDQAEDAFASVATALLRAGVRSVVAMGYSLYVEGARQFLPAFYRELFRTGNVAQATRSGRQAMFRQPERAGLALQDWLVPVLYQQDALELTFAARVRAGSQTLPETIPPEAQLDIGRAPHGVIGRDSAVLALERASRGAPAALLLHGLGGVGKTTLARGYIEWLAHTQGLPKKVIWQNLADVRSFDYLRNRLVEELFGTNAVVLPDEQKWPELVRTLREQAVLVVWDNFESTSGSADAGTSESGETLTAMPVQDRQALKNFLEQLRGGRSKILLTSRSVEEWLGPTACRRVALGGLQGEERRELARAILADQGVRLDPRDADVANLISSLLGHPLMMRAILPKLEHRSAVQLLAELERYQPQASSEDPVEQRLHATLRYVAQGLPQALRPLLVPIGLHEGYVDAGHLAEISKVAGQPYTPAQASQALELLEIAGLVRGRGNKVYEMHPALGRYLRMQAAHQPIGQDERQAWDRGFCEVMATLAENSVSKQLHEQRPVFEFFGGSFEHALALSQARGELDNVSALQGAQADYALNTHNLPLAAQRYEVYAITLERQQREDEAAGACHNLGIVAHEQRDFDTAERWYRKALEIKERLGNERHAASTYHQLGALAEYRRDFDAAEGLFRKSLEISERLGIEHGTAMAYHHLGIVAQERHDFDGAESWYLKSLEVNERLTDEHGSAAIYYQLGTVALLRYDVVASESWCRKSLEIKERLGDEHGAAMSYHQLGGVAETRGDLDAAESWYRKSLGINERLDNEHGAAASYGRLGSLSLNRRDFEAAEGWYRKALGINERLSDEHGAAMIYGQLGRVAEARHNFEAAESWYRKAVEVNERLSDEHSAAMTYPLLGRVAEQRGDFDDAESWYRKALVVFERLGDAPKVWFIRNFLEQVNAARSGSSGGV
jgi:tetratricopeptide (TPR) repeat protein